MAEGSTSNKLSAGFNTYEDILKASKKVIDGWDKVGITDKYSTGLPLLDSYLGGGYGSRDLGEVILIHAGSKTQKSTLSMQLIKTPFLQGEKMGWAIVEGGIERSLRNLRQLFALEGYEKFDEAIAKNYGNIFQMSTQFVNSGFNMKEVIEWMKLLRAEGVSLFVVDPIGYLADYSEGTGESNWQKESKFMKDLVQFTDNTKSTVICITHNVKDSQFKKYREEAIGGSQSFSKSPTKVIELRAEGYIADDVDKGITLSLEMYMARDVRCWKFVPIILEIHNAMDNRGRFFFTPVFDTQEDADAHLSTSAGDAGIRTVWKGQVKAYESLRKV